VRLSEVADTATFRLAALFSAAFTALVLVMFGFIWWQTASEETRRIDRFLTDKAEMLAAQPTEQALVLIQDRTVGDLHRISFAGLFAPDGAPVAGNLAAIPRGLASDGSVREARDIPSTDQEQGPVRLVARRRPDGGLIVLGRSVDELGAIRQALVRALELGLLPAIVLSLAVGALLSLRALSRVTAMRESLERIMRGHIRERLPTRGRRDEFDRLAQSVNLTLDEIERLMDEVRGVGDDIAHDLRTPLARMRVRLERRRGSATTPADMDDAIADAIADIDQAFALIEAILRIGEVETSRRRAAFGAVSLQTVAREVHDLYEPVAEAKRIALTLDTDEPGAVEGDRDLLMEALGNLVDNAIKFTPAGGRVSISVMAARGGPVVTVADTGPGIPPEHRSRVFARFHRVDQSRHVPGNGLGLSLVLAIARIHGFEVTADSAPSGGCVMQLLCGAAVTHATLEGVAAE
jgi:signal transduction histidine kinase